MSDTITLSFLNPNYTGMLFNKGNTKTPFSTMIGGKLKTTDHVQFPTGVEYTTGGGTQPAITETASLTAPESISTARSQGKNVTQIFHESVYISYGKLSNMGTMSGINIARDVPNPTDELDFQVSAAMQKIARDIEATFIAGAYVEAANDTTANKSRGILTAVVANNIYDIRGKALTVWDVANAMKQMYDNNADISNLVLWVDPVTLFQLNADAEANGLSIVPASRNINGLNINTLLTPLGEIGVYLGQFLPAGTAGIFNLDVVSPVQQPVPGKGNFFLEELAKTGAGSKYQIFGQMGLDHGPGFMHGKITGISQSFTAPQSGVKVYTTSPIQTTEVLPVLNKVTLAPATYNVETSALTMEYQGLPTDTPTFAYQWQKSDTLNGTYANISGATSATYTPVTGDKNKFLRVKVTASVRATGTVFSNAVQVAPGE